GDEGLVRPGLELDGVRPAASSLVDEPVTEVDVAVMVGADLGDDERPLAAANLTPCDGERTHRWLPLLDGYLWLLPAGSRVCFHSYRESSRSEAGRTCPRSHPGRQARPHAPTRATDGA